MKFQRILFIAPDVTGLPPLDLLPEVDSMYDLGFQVESVQGQVSQQRIFDKVRRREFDIIHFATHADREGVFLSDCEKLAYPAIVQIAKACQAVAVFLNGCETVEVGQMLVDEDIPAAICTTRALDDVMTKNTGQMFYRALARFNDLRQAFDESKPPIKGGYVFLTDGKLQELQFAPILKKLEGLEAIINGNVQEHDEFRAALLDLRARVEAIDAEQLKGWMLRVVGGTFAISLVLQLLFTVINRLP